MKRLLAVGTIGLFLISPASAEIVGKINDWLIVKEGNRYRVVKKDSRLKKPRHSTSVSSKRKRPNLERTAGLGKERKESGTGIYREIVERLKKGEGEPVYSRIKGFDVERVLDAGPFFGAVISGAENPGALRKAFKLVEKVGNKYFVVGEWR